MPGDDDGKFAWGSLRKQGEDLLKRIDAAFQEVSRGKDVVLIMGAKEIFFGGELSPLSDSVLVKRLNATVLLVDRYQRDNLTFYSILSLNSFLEGRVKAAILNHVPPEKMDHVKSRVIPFLREKGLRSAGAVPEDPLLSAFTVSDLAEWVGGRDPVRRGRGRSIDRLFYHRFQDFGRPPFSFQTGV